MIDEIVKTVRLHLSERLTSPLMGAFVVSWVVWNWRFVVLLLSGLDVKEKFWIVDHWLHPTSLDFWLQCALGPALTSVLFLLIYPHPARWMYSYARSQQKRVLLIRRKIEDETPMTLEESRAFREMMEKQTADMYALLERRDREIEILRARIPEPSEQPKAVTSLQHMKQSSQESEVHLENNLVEALRLIARFASPLNASTLASKLEIEKVDAEFRLGELASRRLIEAKSMIAGEHAYVPTHDGRRYYINWIRGGDERAKVKSPEKLQEMSGQPI